MAIPTAERFATTYAEAVVRFLQTGAALDVRWLPHSQSWVADPARGATASEPTAFRVDSTWSWLTGPLDMALDPTAPGYSAEHVRHRVRDRLLRDGIAATAVSSIALPRNRDRVLVVDDNVDGADSLAMMISYWRMQTEVAYSGRAALRAIRTFRPQAAILDLDLPDLSGFDVAELLQADPVARSIRLIALTGRNDPTAMRRALCAGMQVYLVKPARSTMVRAALDALLSGSEAPNAFHPG